MPQEVSAATAFLNLWFSRVDESTRAAEAAVEPLLSASENDCLARIKSAARRREYLLSRALMRHALSSQYRHDPGDWDIVDRVRAKPVVRNLPEGQHIGLAHSKGLICFALADSRFGIDVEYCTERRDLPAMAKMFMNEKERTRLTGGDVDQLDYFYRSWCAKEACYKMLPTERQEKTLFTEIDYDRLGEGDSEGWLREGKIDSFVFAAVSSDPLQEISCLYFHATEERLGRLALEPVHS